MFGRDVLTELNARLTCQMQKNSFFVYHTLKIQNFSGQSPRPHWGTSQRPQDAQVVWGGYSYTHSSPSKPLATRFLGGA